MNSTADVVLFEALNRVKLGSAQLKECGPREIVTETIYSTISPGTELRTLAGHYGATGAFPFVPGYSSVGRIIAVGGEVSGWRVGDVVSSRNPEPVLGVNSKWGGHASHQVISMVGENKPVLLPPGADPLDYVLTEIASISFRGAEAAASKQGETAVVIGQGIVGALSAAWLVTRGCRVVVMDLEASRLERALRAGAAYAVSPGEPDAIDRIVAICNGGADIVVEASGSTPGISMALKLLRKKPESYSPEYKAEALFSFGGNWPRLVFQANYLEPFPWKPDGTFVGGTASGFPGEAVTIITPRDRSVEERQHVVEHIRAGRFNGRPFVEKIYPWKEAPSAYAALQNRSIFSAVIDWSAKR